MAIAVKLVGSPTVTKVPVIHYDIPADLHRRAKAAAAMNDQTLKAFLIAALERAVDEHKGGKR